MGGSRPLGALWQALPLKGGLGRRILLWFLVLSLVPLLVSNTVGYLVTRRIIEDQIERYLVALTEVEARHVAREVERHQLYLGAVAAGNRLLAQSLPVAAAAIRMGHRRDPVVTELHEHLDRKLAELRPMTELLVIDTTGTVVAATRHQLIGEDWSQSYLFLSGRSGHGFAGEREMYQGQLRPRLWLTTPIEDASGGWVGVLVGGVRFDLLRAFLGLPEHLAGDVHAYIVDYEGRPVLVSHPHAAIDYAEALPSPLIGGPAMAVRRYLNYESEEVFGTAVEVPNMLWLYISEVPVASALGQLRGLALLAAALEGVFALLLVGIVWIVARSIVAPLRHLVAAAERIRRGELGVTVQIEREDELGDLGRTFNQMSEELESSTQKIKEYHEQEMRRAAQLASVGELASGIAHEIKNPLVGVASGVDLLSRKSAGDPKSKATLKQMRTQLGRIETAIHDLLSYASPKKPHLARVDPAKLVDRIVDLVRPQAEAAGVQIRKRQSGPLPKILVDPDQLTHALVNLALNGVQAMQRGGVLEIRSESRDDEVRIAISDTGAGIKRDELEKIFRPFHTTKHQGTGLGLAITRGIIERHAGRLEVESEPDQGSTFIVVIAASREEALAR